MHSTPTNLCPYFWQIVLAVICLPFNFIWNFPLVAFNWLYKKITKEDFLEEKEYFSSLFIISTLSYIGFFMIVAMIGMWFNPSKFLAPGMFGYGVLILILTAVYINWKKEKRSYKSKPNILKEFIKAKYNKHCPQITWVKTK